jgi:hypothetical protein
MEATGWGLPEIDPRIERRLLGVSGAAVIERLRELPPADQAADIGDLEVAVNEVAGLLDAWIGDIGFRWEDLSGDVRFKVLKPFEVALGSGLIRSVLWAPAVGAHAFRHPHSRRHDR